MANHKSAKKRARQNVKRRVINKTKISRVRSVMKSLREALTEGKKDEATSLLKTTQSLLAKLGKTPAMRKTSAARKTSRLAAQVNRL